MFYIKNEKGKYLHKSKRKMEFKEGLGMAFKTRKDAENFCINNEYEETKNGKALSEYELSVEEHS